MHWQVAQLKAEYLARSHRTLLIFRRDVKEHPKGREIELRHQRSPDVELCVGRSTAGASRPRVHSNTHRTDTCRYHLRHQVTLCSKLRRRHTKPSRRCFPGAPPGDSWSCGAASASSATAGRRWCARLSRDMRRVCLRYYCPTPGAMAGCAGGAAAAASSRLRAAFLLLLIDE